MNTLRGFPPSSAKCAIALAIVAALVASPNAAGAQRPRMFGDLQPGTFPVGFRLIRLMDATRPSLPKRDYFGELIPGNRARPLEIQVWYPAAVGGTGAQMKFEDYIYFTEVRPATDASRLAQRNSRRNFLRTNFGQFTDSAWSQLLAMPQLARRDVREGAGKFPIIVGNLRPLSTSITNEYLASHGYVVAMVSSAFGAGNLQSIGVESEVRDLELTLTHMRTLPFVDPDRAATLGFSGSGFAQLTFAMRSREIDAIVDLESGFFMRGGLHDAIRTSLGYNPAGVRIPFLHTMSVPLSREEEGAGIADFEAMRYSTRYRYIVDAPNIHHWDFATEGMAASAVLGLRPEAQPALRNAFEWTNRYVLQFYNAYLKGDATGLAFLRAAPTQHGVPAGLLTITEKPGVKPGPTFPEFETLIERRGIEGALAELRDATVRDPQMQRFNENDVNRVGYVFLNSRRMREALGLFELNTRLYPASGNTFDSYSEALEASGDSARALTVAERGLVVLAAQTALNDAARRNIEDPLRQRVARLKR